MKSILQTLAEAQTWTKKDLAEICLEKGSTYDITLPQMWVDKQQEQNPDFEISFYVWLYEKGNHCGKPVHLLEYLFRRLRTFDYMDCQEWIKERIETEEAYINTTKRLFT